MSANTFPPFGLAARSRRVLALLVLLSCHAAAHDTAHAPQAASASNDVLPAPAQLDAHRAVEAGILADDAALARIEAEVDAQWVAGAVAPAVRGIGDAHGLVRTRVVNGDFTDLPPQSAAFGPEFGHAVALHGEWLVVGAPGTVTTVGENTGAHGALFVFRRQGGTWQQTQMLTRPGFDGQRCGHSVALDPPHLVTGCPDFESVGQQRGLLHHWKLNEEGDAFVYRHARYLDALDAHCGRALAITRNYLAASCPTSNDGNGSVWLFKRNTLTDDFSGEAEHEITGASVPHIDVFGFGEAIAMHEPPLVGLGPQNVRLAIGAPDSIYDGSIWPRGTVHIYHRALDAPSWLPNMSLHLSPTGSDGNELAAFGSALDMSWNQLVIGAPNNRYGAINTLPGPGSVHRYEYTQLFGNVYQWQAREGGGGVNLPDGAHQGMRFGEAVAIAHDNLIAVSAPRTTGQFNNGDPADAVGLVEFRRTAGGDWSVFNYAGETRPAPLSNITRPLGRFGEALDADIPRQRIAIGYPRSGSTLIPPNQPDRPRGAVWIYETDLIFADGFQCAAGFPGCD